MKMKIYYQMLRFGEKNFINFQIKPKFFSVLLRVSVLLDFEAARKLQA